MNRLVKETFTTMKNDVAEKTEGLLLPVLITLGVMTSGALLTIGLAYVLLLLSAHEVVISLAIVVNVIGHVVGGVWLYASIDRAQKKIDKENKEMMNALKQEAASGPDDRFHNTYNTRSAHRSARNNYKAQTW